MAKASADPGNKSTAVTTSNELKSLKSTDRNKSEDDAVEIPTPPDGGWGWMVVLGSFIVHIIADGVAYSFGVVMVRLLEHFEDAGRSEMGWIGSIMVGLTMGVGPIASILESRFGCRVVTIFGTFLCAFGFFISIWAPNVYFMYVSFGVIGGTGLGLIYLPAITCVSYYFEKKRAFATGLAVCGSGLGTFILAPIINACLDEYGWQGTVLIESGLLLNCCVSGMLFRPLEVSSKKRTRNSAPSTTSKDSTLLPNTNRDAKDSTSQVKMQIYAFDNGLKESALSNSFHNITPCEKRTPKIRHKSADPGHAHHKHTPHVAYRKDAFYTASLSHLAQYRSNPDMYRANTTRLSTQLNDNSPNAKQEEKPCSCCACLSLDQRRSLSKTMDFSLFKDIFFEFFAWSNFLTNFTFFIPFMFLPDRAVNLGESEQKGALLVSVIGIFNTAGRIIFGFISDRLDNRLFLYNTSLTLCGIVTCLSAHFPAYPFLAAYAGSYGLLVGVYVTLTPVILVDLLGLEKLSNAFGWVLLFQGIATAMGPPIAGLCFDTTGNYVLALWLFGSMMAVSGIMLYPIPQIGKCLGKPWKISSNDTNNLINIAEYKAVSQQDLNTV